MKPGGSDDLLSLLIYDDKGSAGFERSTEIRFEDIFFITIALRVLFPNQWIGRDSKKIGPIVRRDRAKLDEFAF